MDRKISNTILVVLILVYALMAGLNIFLPQDGQGTTITVSQLPAPLWVIVLATVGLVLVAYGSLALIGLALSRKLSMPEIWDSAVSNRQRFLIPAIVGVGIAILFILIDLLFAPFNDIGRLPHPPFPTSIVASISAGIGEEIIFRLFFISLWTWLISNVILRGRWQAQVYSVVSVFSALAFAMSHLPGIMFFYGWTTFAQVPVMLIAELILLNGILTLFAVYTFRKYGFLAPVGIHMWADMVWHVIWGLF